VAPIAALALVSLSGCAELPAISRDECGNGVVEAGEECDGEGCGIPGSPHACRYVCSAAQSCPPGHRCGADGLCRMPDGGFRGDRRGLVGDSLGVAIGNVDGDPCDDLVLAGETASEVISLASSIAPSCTEAVRLLDFGPGDLALPILGDVLGAGRDALVVPTQGALAVGLSLFGVGPDGFDLVTAPSAPREFGQAMLLTLQVTPPSGGVAADVVVALVGATNRGVDVLALSSAAAGFAPTATLAVPLGAVVATAVGDFDGSSYCDEILYVTTAERIDGLRVCHATGVRSAATALAPIVLPPGQTLRMQNAQLAVGDASGDGRLDVATVTSSGGVLVAHGNGAGGFCSVSPGSGRATPPCTPDQTMGPLTNPGDAGPLVVAEGAVVAFERTQASDAPVPVVAAACEPVPVELRPAGCNTSASTACMLLHGHFDGNDSLDAVTTHNQRAEIVISSSPPASAGSNPIPSTWLIPTTCPPRFVRVGDFDGDFVDDVAFVDQEIAPGGERIDVLAVAYGAPSGPPDPPATIGRLPPTETLTSGRLFGTVSSATPSAGASIATDAPHDLMAFVATGDSARPLGGIFVEGSTSRRLLAPYYFPGKVGIGVSSLVVSGMAAGRFGANKTAHRDLAVATLEDPDGANTSGLWLVEVADGGLSIRATHTDLTASGVTCSYPVGGATAQCALVALDADGDGRDEAVLFGDRVVAVFEAGGGFALRSKQSVPHAFGRSDRTPPRVADFDRDGRPDVLLVDESGSLLVYWGRGDFTFEPRELVKDAAVTSFVVLDLDADPFPEAITAHATGLRVWNHAGARMLRDAALPTPDGFALAPGELIAMGAGDLDGDGLDDFVAMTRAEYQLALGRAVTP
jgi:hypothetical protein